MNFKKAAAECREDLEKIEAGLARLRAAPKEITNLDRIARLEDIRTDLRCKIRNYEERATES